MARIFAVTLFWSALLLFIVQPLVARLILPFLGGSAVVWNTAMVFFQAVLVLGYLWAHLSTRYLGPKRAAIAHGVVMVAAAVSLPIGLETAAAPGDAPIGWLLWALAKTAALPFFALATLAPLLQRWFARATGSDDPYWLYAASNLGSFAALIGYPLLAEPLLGLEAQGVAWSVGYGVLVLLVAGCARHVWSSEEEATEEEAEAVPWGTRLRWVALAAIPSALLIAVTTFITTDLASVPLLWVVPLGLYLLSFVVVFARSFAPGVEATRAVVVVAGTPMLALLAMHVAKPLWATGLFHLLFFTAVCILYHGQLAAERPGAGRLTEFYLWMSIGGVAGGVFSSLVAPLVFSDRWEYPLLIGAALLWLGRGELPWRDRWWFLAAGAVAGVVTAVLFVVAGRVTVDSLDVLVVSFFAGLAALCAFVPRYPRQGLVLVCAFAAVATFLMAESRNVLERTRSYFGHYRVSVEQRAAGEFHVLHHGRTKHGAQAQDPRISALPLTYYHPDSPIGDVFGSIRESADTRPVGVVGLGVGAMAPYTQVGQTMTFVEIDPAVVSIARNPAYFSYLEECVGTCEVIVGDGRKELEKMPDRHFRLLVLDAYNSDAIPTHLLTREAMALYLAKVADDGVVVFHVSNTFLDVGRVAVDIAAADGYAARRRSWWPRESYLYELDVSASEYVAIAKRPEALDAVVTPRWKAGGGDPDGVVWTDDYANILPIYTWK